LPVGEWLGGDMIRCASGDSSFRSRSLSDGISYRLDTEISPRSLPGCEIVDYSMQSDHIHMIMIIPPKYAVCDVVGKLKGMTASRLRKKFAWLGKVYWKENVVWSPGYFVSTVGVDEDKILKYVAWQQAQDSGQAKLEL